MKISIITVVYNRKKYIENTILSVLKQSYKNIEYIIIDGGSNDGTVEIIEKYKENIFYWVSEEDTSMYHAINKGMLKSTGDYILNLNSDDWLVDNKVIEKVVEGIRYNHNYKAFFGNIIRYYESKNYFRKILLMDVSFKKLLLSEHSTFIPHSSLLISREILQSIGFYNLDYKYASDFEFILRIIKNYKVKHLPFFITVFREHPESITGSGKIDLERKAILTKYNLYDTNFIIRKYNYYKGWILYKIKNLN